MFQHKMDLAMQKSFVNWALLLVYRCVDVYVNLVTALLGRYIIFNNVRNITLCRMKFSLLDWKCVVLRKFNKISNVSPTISRASFRRNGQSTPLNMKLSLV